MARTIARRALQWRLLRPLLSRRSPTRINGKTGNAKLFSPYRRKTHRALRTPISLISSKPSTQLLPLSSSSRKAGWPGPEHLSNPLAASVDRLSVATEALQPQILASEDRQAVARLALKRLLSEDIAWVLASDTGMPPARYFLRPRKPARTEQARRDQMVSVTVMATNQPAC